MHISKYETLSKKKKVKTVNHFQEDQSPSKLKLFRKQAANSWFLFYLETNRSPSPIIEQKLQLKYLPYGIIQKILYFCEVGAISIHNSYNNLDSKQFNLILIYSHEASEQTKDVVEIRIKPKISLRGSQISL